MGHNKPVLMLPGLACNNNVDSPDKLCVKGWSTVQNASTMPQVYLTHAREETL